MIMPADIEALAAELLVEAVELEAELERASLTGIEALATARVFIDPRAKAARELRHAAMTLRTIPRLEGGPEAPGAFAEPVFAEEPTA